MKHRPSLFGPLLLIAVGVLWVMSNLGRIEPANFWALAYFFPYALILFGLGLIVRSYWTWAGEVVSILVVILGVLAVIYAPALNWARGPLTGQFPFYIGGPGKPATGAVITETRVVSDFTELDIAFPANVIITQGATAALTITAQEDVLAVLETNVSNGKLYIGYPKGEWGKYVVPTEVAQIKITVQDLNAVVFSSAGKLDLQALETDSLRLVMSGAGDLTVTGLSAERFECVLSGASSVKASGRVDEFDVRISGMGSVDASDLQAQEAEVHISGAGSAQVWAEAKLTAAISGAGSVEYYGDPVVSKSVSGAGSVNRRGDK